MISVLCHRSRRALFAWGLLLLMGVSLLPARPASAGGGSEEVFVVVNGNSWASRTVANVYAKVRQIPSRNILVLENLHGLTSMDSATVGQFRRSLMGPVIEALASRTISPQIACVAWSSDFPYEWRLGADAQGKDLPKYVGESGSLTGLTYLAGLVNRKNPAEYAALGNNFYFSPSRGVQGLAAGNLPEVPASRAFQAGLGWGPNFQPAEDGRGLKYVLSTMLSVTGGRGLSVREATRNLRRSAAADGTNPAGTIYFMENSDVRSRTRMWARSRAADAINALGLPVGAEILSGILPEDREDVAGLMTGAAKFNWPASRSKILPGAICEHLTSWGGVLAPHGSHTAMTDFLRYGAAGSSGTVTEPFAIQAKFPNAFSQLHYVRGCSLAEAFYQSLQGPYQILVVGDPLCQPWAKIPEVALTGIEEGQTLSKTVNLEFSSDMAIAQWRIFIDGVLMNTQTEAALQADLTKLSDGYHELRVVAVADTPIASQGRAVVGFFLDNSGHRLEVDLPQDRSICWDEPLEVSARMEGARRIELRNHFEVLGVIEGAEGTATLDLRRAGLGPVKICPVGILAEGPEGLREVAAEPFWLDVRPSPPREPYPGTVPPSLQRGALVELGDGRVLSFERPKHTWKQLAGIESEDPMAISGYLRAPSTDVYQFQVFSREPFTITLNEQELPFAFRPGWNLLPVSLAEGVHYVRLKARGGPKRRFQARFGGQGTDVLVRVLSHAKHRNETVVAAP
jgi:hypothetical protein